MTTCTLVLISLPRGHQQIRSIGSYDPPSDVEKLDIAFPSFAAGIEMIGEFHKWAKNNNLNVEHPDHLIYAAACTPEDLIAFWKQNYAPHLLCAAERLASGAQNYHDFLDSITNKINMLKALEQLDKQKLYALVAYEF